MNKTVKLLIEQYEGLIKLLEGCAELGCYDNKNRLDYNGFKNVIKSLKEELEDE